MRLILEDHISIIEMQQGSEEWHELRSRHIGSTDTAPILKQGYKSRLRLFHEKVGTWDRSNLEEVERVFWGKVEEEAILLMAEYYNHNHEYMRNYLDGVKARNIWKSPGIGHNKKYPWMITSLDAIEIGGRRLDNGSLMQFWPLDAKNTTSMAMNVYTEGIQREYVIQNSHSMVVLEVDYSEIAFKIDGNKLRIREIPLNQELGQIIVEETRKFHEIVYRAKASKEAAEQFAREFRMSESELAYRDFMSYEPEADSTEDYEQFLKDKYKDSMSNERNGTPQEYELFRHYQQLDVVATEVSKASQLIKNQIMEIMAAENLTKIDFGSKGYYRFGRNSRMNTVKPIPGIGVLRDIAITIIQKIRDGKII